MLKKKSLSLKAYRAWREWTAIPFRGQGYRVDFASNGAAVTYREGPHSITFSSEPVLRVEDGEKHWVLDVCIHRPLRWDNEEKEEIEEEITDNSREEMILSRVETALKAKIGRFRFVRESV